MLNIKAKKTSFQFLYYLLRTEYFQTKYNLVKRVSVQEYITVEDAENIEIPLPLDMKVFEEELISLFNKTESNSKQIQTLENLRDTLLPKLISGEVRIKI